MHSLYYLKTEGLTHIPKEGPALVVLQPCELDRYADGDGGLPAIVPFHMGEQTFRMPILSFIFRETRAIPMASAKKNRK